MRGVMRVVAVATGCALVVAACGSDYKGLSRAEFIKQADKICADHDKEQEAALTALDSEAAANDDEKVVQVLLDELIPIQRDKVADIRKLKPPKENREEVKQLLDDVDAATDLAQKTLEDDPDTALGGEFDPYEKANEKGRKFGFKDCGAEA